MNCPKCGALLRSEGFLNAKTKEGGEEVYCGECGYRGPKMVAKPLQPYVESDGFFDLKDFQKK